MKIETETKNIEILQLIIDKKITVDDLIFHLQRNRLKLSSAETSLNNKNERDGTFSKIDEFLETYVTDSFVSFFLNILHDESNTFLPQRTNTQTASQQTNKINNKNCSVIPEESNVSYNSSFSIISPHNNQSANIKRKSTYSSPKNELLFKSSPKDTYNGPNFTNKNKPRNVAVLSASNLSPRDSFVSPKLSSQGNQSTMFPSKLASKPSLFDFIQSPPAPKSTPTQTRSNELIEDFKNRFHMYQMQNCNQLEQKLQPQASNNSSSPHKLNLAEIRSKILKSMDQYISVKISVLAKLFADLFLNNFIITINTELFFLFQLLTFNPNEEKSLNINNENVHIFECVENCIYFSIKVLSNMECVLKFLKCSTLKELKENIYIKSFVDFFASDSILNTSHELRKEEIKSKLVFFELKQAPFYNDNSNKSFHEKNFSFKNQRDLFYDVLWNWEKNHKLENWNFSVECGEKIRILVSFNENLTNFYQFVKLFQEQLVLICKDDKMLIDTKNEEIDGPEHIRSNYDHMKLKRLSARMSTPNSNYGTNQSPKFLGYQEFFKEFIDITNSPIFHQCLKDNIANEIETIHKHIPETHGSSNDELSIDKEIIQDMLLKLRVLGKFLGYLFFCPYNYPMPNYIVSEVTEIRNNSLMPINLLGCLERSIAKNHLILTIPFVVEFLSMMDGNAYFIGSIKKAFSVLIMIYYSQAMLIKNADFSIDKFLLLLSISWLLQLKKIPSNQIKIDSSLLFSQQNKTKNCLDNTSIVTPILLHFCCPYLDELQNLMMKFSTGVKRFEQKIQDTSNFFPFVHENRDLDESSRSKTDQQKIQMKLIAQFLFLHPNYKRLIEFASETTLLNFIKYYRDKIFKKELMETLKLELRDLFQKKEEKDMEIEKILVPLSKKLSREFGKHCLDHGKIFFKEKIKSIIENSQEKSTSVHLIASTNQIAIYKAIEKLRQWIEYNLNEGIFYQELMVKISKRKNDLENFFESSNDKDVCCLTAETNEIEDSNVVLHDIFCLLKNLISLLLRGQCDSVKSENFIQHILEQIMQYLTVKKIDKKELKPFETQICNSISEILLFHFANVQTKKIEDSLIDRLVSIEEMAKTKGLELFLLKTIICPRNVEYVKSLESKEIVSEFFRRISDRISR